MTVPVLVKRLGEAGAGMDESHGAPSRLYDLMLALVTAGVPLVARQAGAITTGVKASMLVQFDGVVGDFGVSVGDCGSADATVVKVNKNGVALGTFHTIAHDGDDPTVATVDLSSLAAAAFVKGDLITIEVTALGTDAADLDATLALRPATIQP